MNSQAGSRSTVESGTEIERSRQKEILNWTESWTDSCLTNFFAMIFVLGLANEHVLERNELKWCDVPSFVNKTASTIQGAKKSLFNQIYT